MHSNATIPIKSHDGGKVPLWRLLWRSMEVPPGGFDSEIPRSLFWEETGTFPTEITGILTSEPAKWGLIWGSRSEMQNLRIDKNGDTRSTHVEMMKGHVYISSNHTRSIEIPQSLDDLPMFMSMFDFPASHGWISPGVTNKHGGFKPPRDMIRTEISGWNRAAKVCFQAALRLFWRNHQGMRKKQGMCFICSEAIN